mmetsp:Transcript_22094/g.54681  ORF Transcript_22094/g.54681 Transcript_22094/m.54681 type:complete len:270 (-) Transcript_22094:1549-2358(-)
MPRPVPVPASGEESSADSAERHSPSSAQPSGAEAVPQLAVFEVHWTYGQGSLDCRGPNRAMAFIWFSRLLDAKVGGDDGALCAEVAVQHRRQVCGLVPAPGERHRVSLRGKLRRASESQHRVELGGADAAHKRRARQGWGRDERAVGGEGRHRVRESQHHGCQGFLASKGGLFRNLSHRGPQRFDPSRLEEVVAAHLPAAKNSDTERHVPPDAPHHVHLYQLARVSVRPAAAVSGEEALQRRAVDAMHVGARRRGQHHRGWQRREACVV